MITGKTNRFHRFGFLIIVVGLIVFSFFTIYYCRPQKLHKQLQGNCFIVFDSLLIHRYNNIYFLDYNIQIRDQKITLPPIISNRRYLQTSVSVKEFRKLEECGKGEWEVTSINPDSISIESISNPLNGRYAVKILDDIQGIGLGYVILDNDSTHIVLQKHIHQ